MRLFGELTKIEDQPDGTLKVYGVASTGARDDAGEIVKPEAMKAALPDYARYPALREMHQPTAAGRTLEATVDDDGATRIVAHVVDPVAIAKVKSRTYSGFSIGGKVLARDPADATVITRLKLTEISLVDRPANPEAVIDLWKADAVPPSNAAVKARAADMAAAAGRPGAWKDYVAKARAEMLDAPPAEGGLTDENDHDDSGAAEPAAPMTAETERSDAAASLADLAAQDPGQLQALHDALVALGACCDPDNCPAAAKSVIAGDLGTALPRFEALERRLAEQDTVIQRLAAQPQPPRAAASAHAVGKAEDATPSNPGALSPTDAATAFAALTPDDRAFLLMKASLRQPIPIG